MFLATLRVPHRLSIDTSDKASDDTALAKVLVGLFSDPDGAAFIGRSYIELYPERAEQESLLHDLGSELTGPASRNDPRLREFVSYRQQRDFERGDTVIINNWILSRSEVSLCALAAIS